MSCALSNFAADKVISEQKPKQANKLLADVFTSPEVYNNQPYSSKTDIWSLGCLLHEMCNLQKPFDGNPHQVKRAVINK